MYLSLAFNGITLDFLLNRLVWISIAIINPWPKAAWERVYLTLYHTVHQWRELEAGLQGRNKRRSHGRVLLTSLLHLDLLSLLSCRAQDHLSMDGTAYSGLDPFKFVITQENATWTYLQVNLMQTFPQLRFLLRWLWVCTKLAQTISLREDFSNKLTHNSHSPKHQTSSMYQVLSWVLI